MAEPDLQALFEELRKAQQRSPAVQGLLGAIALLEDASKPHRLLMGRKRVPRLRAGDRDRLMDLHRQIGAQAENVLAAQENDDVKDMVRKIAALSAENYRALLQYDPAKGLKTLEAIEEEARTKTLHLDLSAMRDSKGANLSARYPLAFVDENGKRLVGLFTTKSEFNHMDTFRKGLTAEMEKATPEEKAVLQGLLDNFETCNEIVDPKSKKKVDLHKSDLTYNLSVILSKANEWNKGPTKGAWLNPKKLPALLNQILPKEQQKPGITLDLAQRLSQRLTPMTAGLIMNVNQARIPDGSRIDNRNAAMSAVADLLGMPEVVCRSRVMRLVGRNGEVVEGTFMEAATGLDRKNLAPSAEFVDPYSYENTLPGGRLALAKLQILDYICGNVDRHGANFTYQFNSSGQFSGVQGFDNDCAFGTRVPTDGNGFNRLVGIKNMRAVPQSTFNKLMALNTATLKYALRGFGLSEAELEAAGMRLTNLQDGLRASNEYYMRNDFEKYELVDHAPRVIRDKDFGRLDLASDLTQNRDGHDIENTFTMALGNINTMANAYENQKTEYENLRAMATVGVDNRANRSTAEREVIRATAMSKMLSKRSWFGFSSPAYRAMQGVVKEYLDYYKRLNERLIAANDPDRKRSRGYNQELEAVVKPSELEEMRQLCQRMKDVTQAYLNNKLTDNGQLPANASDYTRSRVAAARDILAVAEKGLVIRPEEQQMAAENLQKANTAVQKRQAASQQGMVR